MQENGLCQPVGILPKPSGVELQPRRTEAIDQLNDARRALILTQAGLTRQIHTNTDFVRSPPMADSPAHRVRETPDAILSAYALQQWARKVRYGPAKSLLIIAGIVRQPEIVIRVRIGTVLKYGLLVLTDHRLPVISQRADPTVLIQAKGPTAAMARRIRILCSGQRFRCYGPQPCERLISLLPMGG